MAVTLLDLDGEAHVLDGSLARLDATQLTAATGWALKPEGLCRGEVCVPLHGRAVAIDPAQIDLTQIDLTQWAQALGYALAIDVDHQAAALAPGPHAAASLEVGSDAPDVTLPDIEARHTLTLGAGRPQAGAGHVGVMVWLPARARRLA